MAVPNRTYWQHVKQLTTIYCYQDKDKCPICGAPMRELDGAFGPFFGCTSYPDCRGTRKIDGTIPMSKSVIEHVKMKLKQGPLPLCVLKNQTAKLKAFDRFTDIENE